MSENEPYYVVIRVGDRVRWSPAAVKIWRCHDPDYVWGSPAYEVLDYFGSRRDAQAFVRGYKEGERA